MQKITTCLWFDDQAEEAANFYCSLFDDSRIVEISRSTDAGPGEPGSVLTVTFELAGQRFVGLNGGPQFTFSEAISMQISCADQAEVDKRWVQLTDGGEEGPCGWVKDRYGLSWQIVPDRLLELINDPDRARAAKAMQAMLQMKKIDIQTVEDAANS